MLIVGYMSSVLNFNRKEVYILGGLGAEPPRKCLIFALKLVEISWYVDSRIYEECLEF